MTIRRKASSDQGWTCLHGGRKVRKDHPMLCIGGELDELNSALGAAQAFLSKGRGYDRIRELLRRSQAALLEAGCAVCGAGKDGIDGRRTDLTGELECSARVLAKDLPFLRSFILPGGSPAGAWLHVARSVCRRAERVSAGLPRRGAVLRLGALLNRLSNWLFTAARWVNAREGRPESVWAVARERKRR